MKYMIVGLVALSLLACAPVTSGDKGGNKDGNDTIAPVVTAGYVKGVITAKGSIWVDGVEYDTAGAAVSVDGEPGDDSSLQVGMTVEFNATVDPTTGKGIAETVSYESSAKGLIESIDSANSTFSVLGQTIQTGLLTVFEGTTDLSTLSKGTFVEVSGQLDPTTVPPTLVADRVEAKSTAEMAKIRGVVSLLDTTAKTFTVTSENNKTFSVAYTESGTVTLDPAVVDGAEVRVKFTPGTSATITALASDVQVRKSEVRIPENGKLELHGIVSGVTGEDPVTFTIDGRSASVSAAVLNQNSEKPQVLVDGAKVELKGNLDASQVVVVTKIEVKRSESDLKKELKELEGSVTAVDAVSGTFSVGSVALTVTPLTMFRGRLSGTNPLENLTVGASVGVKYLVDAATGLNMAVKVEVKGSDGKPEGDHPEDEDGEGDHPGDGGPHK